MTIPTRDELIERISDCQWNGMVQVGTAVSFTAAEIRRAVADELEALREGMRSAEGGLILNRIDARLAALRADQLQPMPPPTVFGPNHADGCKGNLAYYSGDGYDRVRVCQCGAEDHEPAMRAQESGHYETAGVTGPGSESVKVREDVAAPALSDAEPPCSCGKPSTCWILGTGYLCEDCCERCAARRNVAAPALSDADALERAAEVLDRHKLSAFGKADGLREDAAKLRAASAPVPAPKCSGCGREIDPEVCGCGGDRRSHSYGDGHGFIPMGCDCYRDRAASAPEPVDVFRAFSMWTGDRDHKWIEGHARDWFGPLVAALEKARHALGSTDTAVHDAGIEEIDEALSALRQRAQEAIR